MLELRHGQLQFSFPEVHPHAACTITLVRTLRIPDQRGKVSQLPPGIGNFPLQEVATLKEKLAPELVARGGVALPMYQAEALYIDFSGNYVPGHGVPYPMAIKVSAGKRSAITGKPWSDGLVEKDYVWIPQQKYLDGFVDSDGVIRQFIAMPLGLGTTVEEQITGKAEFGGLQIEVFPMRAEEFKSRFPPREERTRGGLLGLDGDDGLEAAFTSFSAGGPTFGATAFMPSTKGMTRGASAGPPVAVQSMGMAAGGAMKQQIFEDTHGIRVWDVGHPSKCFVHLFNSQAWKALTGNDPPTKAPTAAEYTKANLPWFDYYREAPTLGTSPDLAQVKSVAELQDETGSPLLPENEDCNPAVVKGIPPGTW